MYKRKYKQGEEIRSFEELRQSLRRDKFVYLRDKIAHAGWVISLQFRYLANLIDNGLVHKAIKK